MEEKIVVQKSGIGFSSLLGLVFLVLKLLGVIAWPWVWVLSPFWIPLAIGIIAIVIVCIIAIFIE